MNQIVNAGDFCPNEACSDYGKLQVNQSKRNIKKYGRTANGTQRYPCKTGRQTFTATKGPIFYRRRTPMDEIWEVLAFLAEGVRISTLAQVKGHKEETMIEWLAEVGKHVTVIEALLQANDQLERGQLDAMGSFGGNKGEKAYPETEESGPFWRATMINRETRLRGARALKKMRQRHPRWYSRPSSDVAIRTNRRRPPLMGGRYS